MLQLAWDVSSENLLPESLYGQLSLGSSALCSLFIAPLYGDEGKRSITQVRDKIAVDQVGRFEIPAGTRVPRDILVGIILSASVVHDGAVIPLGVYPLSDDIKLPDKVLRLDPTLADGAQQVEELSCLIRLERDKMGDFERYFTDRTVGWRIAPIAPLEIPALGALAEDGAIHADGGRERLPVKITRKPSATVITFTSPNQSQ
jgi:hypothetical protein